LRLEPRSGNATILEAQRQTKNVTTHGICDLYRTRGIGQIASVMRVAKVFHYSVIEHPDQYKSHCATLNVRLLADAMAKLSGKRQITTFRFFLESD